MKQNVSIQIKTLPHYEGLPLPSYGTDGAACMDIYAAIDTPITLQPLERKIIPTGFCLAIPDGYELQIRSRSGNPIKNGLIIANGIGTIDSDYRGELGVGIINTNKEPVTIERGFKIAQICVQPVYTIQWEKVEQLNDTARGSGGFGSTGNKAA
jgi:dUTP pyrophosphatase